MELDQLLERTTEVAGQVLAGVKPEQYDDPTPCANWKVRDVMNHIIGGNHFFAGIVSGEPLPTGDAPDLVGDDPATAYAQGAKVALEAWRQPGATDRTLTMPFGDLPGTMVLGLHFVDHLVHSWDIAKATGQETALDPELAETAYGMMKGTIPEQFRTGDAAPFGPEVPCAEDAPTLERLVAYLGRRP